jgi:hypothetical protein
MSEPIALSDRQLRILLLGAERLPHLWRDRYMRAVADQLQNAERPLTDIVVEAAVNQAVERMSASVNDRTPPLPRLKRRDTLAALGNTK